MATQKLSECTLDKVKSHLRAVPGLIDGESVPLDQVLRHIPNVCAEAGLQLTRPDSYNDLQEEDRLAFGKQKLVNHLVDLRILEREKEDDIIQVRLADGVELPEVMPDHSDTVSSEQGKDPSVAPAGQVPTVPALVDSSVIGPNATDVSAKQGPKPEVAQQTRKVVDLKPHALNVRIYGDHAHEDFVQSIRIKGVLEPVVITNDDRIISGYRRWDGASKVGLETIPVSVFGSSCELDIVEALVHANKQRQKTNEQIGREFTELARIEQERAKLRQQNAAAKGGKASGRVRRGETKVLENFPEPSGKGAARDQVGKDLGISGKTGEKAAAVVKAIDGLKAKGKSQKAEYLRTALNKSVQAGFIQACKDGLIPSPRQKTSKATTTKPPAKKPDAPTRPPSVLTISKETTAYDMAHSLILYLGKAIAGQVHAELGRELHGST